MGNLLIQIEHSDLHATLEKLATQGVEAADFELLRRFPSFLAEVSLALKSLRLKLDQANGVWLEDALAAVASIQDTRVLIEIARTAHFVPVQVAAVNRVASNDEHLLYDLARLHDSPKVVSAAVEKMTSWERVLRLYNCHGNDTWRSYIFEESYRRRFNGKKGCPCIGLDSQVVM